MKPPAAGAVSRLVRWTPLLLLIACGAPSSSRPAPRRVETPAVPVRVPAQPSAPAAPAAPAMATEAPGLPTFARSGELFMVVVAGTTARCEAWTIDADRRVLISKQDARELAFEVSGKTLAFTGLTRYRGDELHESGSCDMRFEARETDLAIVLDGAKLFRTAAGCATAVAHHERVATNLECAIAGERAPERAQQATRARFETMLAHGGTLYTIVDGPDGDTCRTVRVRAAKARDRWLGGSFEHDVVRDDGVKGTTSLSYEMKRGATTITFLGPGTTWRDGSSQAFG
jgi:hypothetical protein